LKEREFLKTKEPIFKIGKTIEMKNRMPAYPKQSILHGCFYCPTNIDLVERYLITLFDAQFIKRTDIGTEYYEDRTNTIIEKFAQFMQTYGSLQ
jgi:hypothetical protein